MEQSKKWYETAVDNVFNLIYSKEKKIERYVIFLMVIGFFLRLKAALNLGVFPDDMVFASQSAGTIGSGIISTHSNPPLFFYLTDLAYNLLGYTTLASRFWPLICGTMLIGVMFLITRKLFNPKIGLFAAFFVTFSTFLTRMTFSEHSLVIFFLAFFGVYVGMIYLESKNINWLICSGILFGLALLTKYNAPFMIFSFIIFSYYYLKVEGMSLNKKILKQFGIFILILIIFFIPVIAFNYFVYQDKGIVDVYFSRVVHLNKTQEIYGGLAGQENSFLSNFLNLDNYNNYKLAYKPDLLMFICSIFGLISWFKNKKKIPLVFLFLFLLIPFVLQSAGAPLPKHFVFMPLLLSIPAGYALNSLLDKIPEKKYLKIILLLIFALFMIINLGNSFGTPAHYDSKSANSEIKSYINDEINKNELIVFDDRIYNARIFWLATDNSFLTMGQFPEFYDVNQKSNLSLIPVKTYFVECAIDDCGWGWVATNQELNQSIESMFNQLKESESVVQVQSIKEKTYLGKNEIIGNNIENEVYKIYSADLLLNPGLVDRTRKMQQFYFVPYMYENLGSYLFNYEAKGIGSIINSLSLFLIYISIILIFLTLLAIIILL